MSLEKSNSTLQADRNAASQLAQEVYDKGVTDPAVLDDLDDAVQEVFEVSVFDGKGNQIDHMGVRNIGQETINAMAVDSGTWQDPTSK